MKGLIFNIKRYAIHDGPGIRVTFFLKGCPLACWWCHNPEGIKPYAETVQRIDRIGEKEFVVDERVGREYSVQDLLDIAEKDSVFVEESGGGVTFSGGEPLLQAAFLSASLTGFKDHGWHTTLDTSGMAAREVIEDIIPKTDLFLFDIKHLDDEKHRKFTGVSNKKILENYNYILASGKDVIVRIPLIPGYNDDKKHLSNLKSYLSGQSGTNLKRIDLLPYHRIGSSKYLKFGLEYKMEGTEQPGVQRMKELKDYFESAGFSVKIGG